MIAGVAELLDPQIFGAERQEAASRGGWRRLGMDGGWNEGKA
jgi:hypothetical protein